MAVKLPNPKYIRKPYEKMDYPCQRVQIDVKIVSKSCLVGEVVCDTVENGSFYYQYTFIDEYSRFRYANMIDDLLVCIEAQINSTENEEELAGLRDLLSYYTENKGAMIGPYER